MRPPESSRFRQRTWGSGGKLIGHRYAILAAYLAGLLAVTLAPLPGPAFRITSSAGLDKPVHFVLFGTLAALVYAVRGLGKPTAPRVVGAAAVLAALIEIVQGPLPYRSSDVWDFLWGVAGAVAGYVGAAALERK